MNYILFDDPQFRTSLLPFTFTRPVSQLRSGIVTIAEKWEHFLRSSVSDLTEEYLQTKFPPVFTAENTYINASVLPVTSLLKAIDKLKTGQKLIQQEVLIAFRTDQSFKSLQELISATQTQPKAVNFPDEITIIRKPYDLFIQNGAQIRFDFKWLTEGRESTPVSDAHTSIYNPSDVFIEEGAVILSAVLNAQAGPIYIGKNTQIQEGSLIRGAFAICEGSTLHMGSKMRGDNTIGPNCKVGGEITNSIIMGNSNKAHEGYLGNSVIGEWCNLGADSNTSNMKNDYGTVKLWSYAEKKLVDTGLHFCGLMMGDHSKAGINTMFNTGTVVGVSANIFGADFPPKYIPSFSWGGARGLEIYQLEKALEVADRAMQRRNQNFQEVDRNILEYIFKLTHQPSKRIGFI
ncbi:glucose-1-phosphate thymidylyltransferase [Rhodocytophaga rosea]|uniref:Glucose-1-phosphate thymidylyltransferase n=1 Tax=Rhodocytophaga rosea TaxID=2704465 RepID=A0A6C0GGY9_9BACT|nr:GlmU family protein [Rhodocytophaga rosea]QHT67145.1 glucose-1-phosphate thymidylyltransferase [Rhodocytophaga rosea]